MKQAKTQNSIESEISEKRGLSTFIVLLISISLFAIAIITVLYLIKINRTYPTDCEIAHIVYQDGYIDNDGYPDPIGSFDEFLEERFRTYGIVRPGGIFSNPTYGFALYYPKRRKGTDYVEYYYLISRENKLYSNSREALSTPRDGWESGRKITCNDTKEEMK